MSSQRYERVSTHDADDHVSSSSPVNTHNRNASASHQSIPSSPPPSFHSRSSSLSRSRLLTSDDPLTNDAERTLADTFDSDSDDDDDDGGDDRQRLMRGQRSDDTSSHDDATGSSSGLRPQTIERRVTQLPVCAPRTAGGVPTGGRSAMANDGVFANLSAKPTRGEDLEEKPPTYEQAAADATPPYWETTILAPGMSPDDVFVDGLPVGSAFSFAWNALISTSFQLVGFLLTYLLHTTHAAKNGSRAGLGITLIQLGFTMKGSANLGRASPPGTDPTSPSAGGAYDGVPADPNNVSFDPATAAPDTVAADAAAAAAAAGSGLTGADWIAYLLMVLGWFVLIKSVSDFLRARRHEQLVLQSPERGLGVVPVVAEGERPESAV